MKNSEGVQIALDEANASVGMEKAVVVCLDSGGKLHLFLAEADKEAVIVLLERARNKLVQMLDE